MVYEEAGAARRLAYCFEDVLDVLCLHGPELIIYGCKYKYSMVYSGTLKEKIV